MTNHVQESLVKLNQILADKLSQQWLVKWNTAYEAVGVIQTSKSLEYANHHHYVWQQISEVNKNLIPFFSNDIQAHWKIVYTFLENNIGSLIQKFNEEQQRGFKVWDEAIKRIEQQDEHCYVAWGMQNPISIDDIYPVPVKRLYYTNESGWGNPGSMDLPDNATYFDIFKVANNLIVKSGDTHHIFLERLNAINKKPDCYVLSLGS